ncbi:hypothetical protein C8J56DRAFT_1110606 [Mycena floridula]|nr:hypothetical protein C8J56DRAFT_1110606 [Mycena floridula]
MSATSINYAKAFGFKSTAAAFLFAVIYMPLAAWFVFQSLRKRTYVVFVLTVFCTIRVTAFILRGILTSSDSAGENSSLFIADETLFGIGFFGILYSAFTLVLDRLLILEYQAPPNILSRIVSDRRVFRAALMVAVIIGVVGITDLSSSKASDITTGQHLRKISTIVFLVLTILQAYQTFLLFHAESSHRPAPSGYSMTPSDAPPTYIESNMLGRRHGSPLFLAIAALLLVREAFMVATLGDTAKQNREALWYPLVVIPELLAVLLFTVPGLVPSKSEIPSPK